ncbi:MAG: elongation factor P 5-aminopentanone reductase [Oscillospiraceae bacterium]
MRKTALVTGASRGIGRAAAETLARSGWAVAMNYRENRTLAEEAAERLRREGCDAAAFQADVADRAAVDRMVRQAEERFGAPVSLLVCCAGIARQEQFQDVTEETWRRLFAVNVDGAFHCAQAVLPAMLHAHAGNMIFLSSIWGQRGASCEVAYAATKAAVIGLARSLAAELAPSGIRVNCVAPGVIETDMVRVLGEETLRSLAEETPMGRLGTPEEVAKVVRFLASEESSFLTGQVITADGGFTL